MARGGGKTGNGAPNITIIRREEVVEGGHHGGAWKVAYADFVTAMMAFFLLMWLLNATTEKQRRGIAEYFAPSNALGTAATGSGQPFGGHTPFDEGAMVSDKGVQSVINGPRPPLDQDDDPDSTTPAQPRPHRRDTPTDQPDAAKDQAASSVTGDMPPSPTPSAARTQPAARQGAGSNVLAPNPLGAGTTPLAAPGENPFAGGPATTQGAPGNSPGNSPGSGQGTAQDAGAPSAATKAELRAEAARQERQAFAKAAQEIRDAVRGDPQLAALARQLSVDMTPEGLRIQLMDEDKLPMFASGSAAPNDRARQLLRAITPVLMRLPEQLSIAGHTDAAPFPGPDRTNWELSTERANATRRMLTEDGLPDSRIRSVTGNADRDPLLPADPLAAANRRIAIVVLRAASPPDGPRPGAAQTGAGPAGTGQTGTGQTGATQPGAARPQAGRPAAGGPADSGSAARIIQPDAAPAATPGPDVAPPPAPGTPGRT
jgi:chemotaxis protein MotB